MAILEDRLGGLGGRVAMLMHPVYANGWVHEHPLTTPAEVRVYTSQVTQIQTSLRLLKSKITTEIKRISAMYADLESHFDTNRSNHGVAPARRKMHQGKRIDLAPYHQATHYLDQQLAFLDRLKLRAQQIHLARQQDPNVPLHDYTCQYCGLRFRTLGGQVVCSQCAR